MTLVVVAVVLLMLAGPLLYAWWRDWSSRAWPVADAAIDSTRASKMYRRSFALEIAYSYSVNGILYNGVCTLDFPTEAAAQQLMTIWGNSTVPVRYDPRRPARSYLDPYRDGAGLMTPPRQMKTAEPRAGEASGEPMR